MNLRTLQFSNEVLDRSAGITSEVPLVDSHQPIISASVTAPLEKFARVWKKVAVRENAMIEHPSLEFALWSC
jgi:hypothetical protein